MRFQTSSFYAYLIQNFDRFSFTSIHPGIRAVLEGDFTQLPLFPSDNDWQTLALMIDGYEMSKQVGLGDLGDFLVRQSIPHYFNSGELPKKSIELWILLFGMQRREKWNERPLVIQEKKLVIDAYKMLRKKLMEPKGVTKMIRSMNISENENFRNSLIHRYWIYQETNFQPWKKYFDRPNNEYQRPPVFLDPEKNIITNPDTNEDERQRLFSLIPSGDLHKWFCSMNSSQALALSVLGNLFIYDHLAILSGIQNDDGLSLMSPDFVATNSFFMERKVDILKESRQTSLDAFIPGDYQIAIECKFIEQEVGPCSRPGLTEDDSNYLSDHCDGSYTRQRNRKERCTLTENKVKYWEYIPYLFNWDANRDIKLCPLNHNYQLVRNILAACVKTDGSISIDNGHAILIYDERNPACQKDGKLIHSYTETKNALKNPQLLRKTSWQTIINQMRDKEILPWLTEQLKLKYGL